MKRIGWICASLLLAWGLAGCGPDDDEVRGELEVLPTETWLSGSTKTVVLTAMTDVDGGEDADPIIYPLEWGVANPSVGYIVSQSADRAVYMHISTYAGGNAITVRDQIGREGLVVVNWEPDEEAEE